MNYTVTNTQGEVVATYEKLDENEIFLIENAGLYVTPTVDYDEDYDDSMDGDHASALAAAGWGTDEDYDYHGDYYEGDY